MESLQPDRNGSDTASRIVSICFATPVNILSCDRWIRQRFMSNREQFRAALNITDDIEAATKSLDDNALTNIALGLWHETIYMSPAQAATHFCNEIKELKKDRTSGKQ